MEKPQLDMDDRIPPITSRHSGQEDIADRAPDTHSDAHSQSPSKAYNVEPAIKTKSLKKHDKKPQDPDLNSMAVPRHIFLASLGNPAPYANTLHSAGHILLDALSTHLNLPPLSSNSALKPGRSTSTPDLSVTLWQSPTLMNASGKPLVQAWKSYLSQLPADTRTTAKLYVVHDELEAQLGKIKIRHTGSAKGHNGIKSVIAALGGRQDAFSRIGVGIGRPESREPADVSRYVLRACRGNEVLAIRGAAAEVARLLEIG